ncbi:MAG: hypothetical protein WC634_03735 [archaeon]
MLGFILSKLNLLILVTAMFAIISFFLFGLTGIVVSNLAQLLVKDYSESVFGLVSGGQDQLCHSSSVVIPESIEYFGGLMPSQRFYYVMNIKRFPVEFEEGKLSTLIFQIASRKEPDKIIATSSIDVNARIFLYDWDIELDRLVEKSSITLDPESMGVARKNSMVLAKEVYNGKTYLHIIACSSSGGICETNLDRASCWLSTCYSEPRQSSCLPKAEQCASRVYCGE